MMLILQRMHKAQYRQTHVYLCTIYVYYVYMTYIYTMIIQLIDYIHTDKYIYIRIHVISQKKKTCIYGP